MVQPGRDASIASWIVGNSSGTPTMRSFSHSSGMPLPLKSLLVPEATSHSSGIWFPLQSAASPEAISSASGTPLALQSSPPAWITVWLRPPTSIDPRRCETPSLARTVYSTTPSLPSPPPSETSIHGTSAIASHVQLDPLVATTKPPVPPALGKLASTGSIATISQGCPAWVSRNTASPTSTTPLRSSVESFAATSNATAPPPMPSDAINSIHDAAVVADHGHAGPLTFTMNSPSPPAAPIDASAGVTPTTTQGAASWTTRWEALPTRIAASRGSAWALARTSYSTVPEPAPLPPAVITTHAASETAA